jgi:hypothetical protein
MIGNYRTGLIWGLMRRHPQVVAGLRRAGCTGGWLEVIGVVVTRGMVWPVRLNS